METPTGMFGKLTAALQRCIPARTGLVLATDARLFGRATAGFRELRGNFGGLRLVAPARRLAAVAPGARPVEGVHAEAVHFLHLMHPRRMHPVRMVVRGFCHLGQPELAVEHGSRDLSGAVPHLR